MGYAFDSTSNFNATWSNSYGTIVCAPGQATGAGFARAAGKTYFEFVIDSQRNNSGVARRRGHLFLGGLWRGGASQWTWLFGGDRNGDWQISNASGDLSSKLATYGSMTWSTGDVVGVAVNYSGDGIGGMSSLTFTGQCVIEIAKNGVFLGHRAVFTPSGAFVGFRPLVAQDSGTSLSVVVSLRVDSLSLSYAPAGYSGWGTSGGVTVTGPAPYVWEWSSYNKGVSYSITGTSSTTGNVTVYIAQTLTSSWFVQTVRTNALPTTYKVQFELRSKRNITQSNNIYFGFIAEGKTTITYTMENPAFGTYTYSGRVLGVDLTSAAYRSEGFQYTSQLYKTGGDYTGGQDRGFGGWYDPAKGLVGLYGTTGANYSLSAGESIVTPDTNRPLMSMTSSTSLFMFIHFPFFDTIAPSPEEYTVNGGWMRMMYPLLPGWYSADLTRYVSPGGCAWVRPTTMTGTQTIANEVIAYIQGSSAAESKAIMASGGHNSGKKYFEIVSNASTGVGRITVFGVTAKDTISFVTGTTQLLIDQAKIAWTLQNGPTIQSHRDGVTISANASPATPAGAQVAFRTCVAVDFDIGRVWLGYAANLETRVWSYGDPSIGTNGYTITANTTLFPFIGTSSNVTYGVQFIAAFQDDAMLFDPPTGFSAWDAGSPGTVTTTATVTPSFTGCVTTTSTASSTSTGAPGGGGFTRPKWPFGIRP